MTSPSDRELLLRCTRLPWGDNYSNPKPGDKPLLESRPWSIWERHPPEFFSVFWRSSWATY